MFLCCYGCCCLLGIPFLHLKIEDAIWFETFFGSWVLDVRSVVFCGVVKCSVMHVSLVK